MLLLLVAPEFILVLLGELTACRHAHLRLRPLAQDVDKQLVTSYLPDGPGPAARADDLTVLELFIVVDYYCALR